MPDQRRIQRHTLPNYLRVYNRHTGKPMGAVGNMSVDGLMLISELPMLVGATFDMYFKIPAVNEAQTIAVRGRCVWSREDVTPGTYDSGFTLVATSDGYEEMIDALRRYFSFVTTPTATPR